MRPAAAILTAGLVLGGVALAQDSAEAVFSQANEYFRMANKARDSAPSEALDLYRRAALRYEALTGELGVRSSELYYNLGNAYLQMDDVGRAILNYRIAQRLDPGDPNVLRNLEIARTTRADRLDRESGSPVLETLLFWHYDLSRSARLRIFAFAWVAFWVLVLLRQSGRDWVPREIALALLLAGLLVLASFAQEVISEARSVAGVVIATETIARQGDGLSYDPAFEDPLHAGAEFQVLEERLGWHRVQLPDGRRCWLSERDVELVRWD